MGTTRRCSFSGTPEIPALHPLFKSAGADSDLRDHDMQWDFWSLLSRVGPPGHLAHGRPRIPKTWRHMNGYSKPHVLCGSMRTAKHFWVKYHFKTDQGIQFLTQAEADRLAGYRR